MPDKKDVCGNCRHFIELYIKSSHDASCHVGIGRGFCLLQGHADMIESSSAPCTHFLSTEIPLSSPTE